MAERQASALQEKVKAVRMIISTLLAATNKKIASINEQLQLKMESLVHQLESA